MVLLSKRKMRVLINLFLIKALFFLGMGQGLADGTHATTNSQIQLQIEQAKNTYYSGDVDEALRLFLPLSKLGNSESQYYLGLIYSANDWVKRDASLAMTYLLSAADQNHIAAMWQIGQVYEMGVGVEKNVLIATDWYRKSEIADNSKLNIQYMKLGKNNVSLQSTANAVDHLQKEAESGDTESQFKLAKVYDSGKLVPKDLVKAFKWYELAARSGHSYSMYMVGYFYCRGLIGGVNIDLANGWLQKSGRASSCG